MLLSFYENREGYRYSNCQTRENSARAGRAGTHVLREAHSGGSLR
jgi:hypothetical protein